MKRKIDFGTIDFYKNGQSNRVIIDVELKEKENGEKVFLASGEVWNARHTDIICGGQCLDDLLVFFKDNKFYKKIHDLWKKYHLNDMYPECEHQHTLGWHDLASKPVILNIYEKTIDTITEQNKIEKEVMSRLKNGENVKLTDHEKKVLDLKYEIITAEPLDENLSKYYEQKGTKTEILGLLRPNEYKFGLLGRACPICNYKYGSSWNYFAIPQNDLNEIINIIDGGQK